MSACLTALATASAMTNHAAPSTSAGNRSIDDIEVDRDRDAAGQVDDCGEQATTRERSGLQSAGQVAELLDRQPERRDGAVDLVAEHLLAVR